MRRPNAVKRQIAKDIRRGANKVVRGVVSSFVHFSRRGVEYPLGPLEMAPRSTSIVANPTTYEMGLSEIIVNNGTSASQSDDLRSGLSMETARPAEYSSVVTEAQSKSPATVVDKCLNDLPSARRKNPTATILPKVDMKNAIEYQGSMLYEKLKGQWVAEPLPEKPAEIVAPATTQILGARTLSPTPTMV